MSRELTCFEFVELVTDYLEDRLPADARERFELHLERCPHCTRYLDQMRETLRVLGRIPEESISEQAERELLGAFRDWSAAR